ncbi:MAG: diphthamide synthesis protein [Candidatus Woesearchaeota archaeon]|jgi:2-(3-amino-3-carboxypropyl)histidine synthase
MKTLFIPAYKKTEFNADLSKLPKNIAVAYSIQYKELAENLIKKLSKTHTIYNMGQVLGCSSPKLSKSVKAILLIGNGRFHAINLALSTKLPIYILEENKLSLISKQEIEHLEQKRKSAYVNFLNSDKIGILISTKPGQQNMKTAINIKKAIKNKKSYLFIANEINVNEFENFNEIQSWVNTACPRMDMNSNKIINYKQIKN